MASGAFKIVAVPNEAIAARNEGLALRKAKKADEAMPYYDRAIRLYPEYAEAYQSRCAAYSDLDKYDQAMSDCNRAIHIEPGFALAYHSRGAIYERTGQHDQAIADYNQALELNPNDGLAYANRAITYYHKNDYEKAAKDVSRAQQLGHQVPPALLDKLRQASQASQQAPQKVTPDQRDAAQAIPRLQWKFKAGGRVYSPAAAHGVVYVGSEDDHLYALQTNGGQLKWKFKTALLDARPAVVDGVVYFCDEYNLLAVDSKTGRELWKFDTKEVIFTGSPTVADRVVYFGTGKPSLPDRKGYGRLYAVDSETGQQKPFRIRIGDKFTTDSSPAVANGVIYLGSEDGHLYAFEPPFDTQARRPPTIWKFKTGAAIASSAAVADGIVYVASWDKHLYAVDIKTQQEKWKFKTGGAVLGSLPAVADGVVYVSIDDSPHSSVSNADSHLYAVDAKTGRERWKFKTGDKVLSSPAVADGVVYVGSEDGYLYAINGLAFQSHAQAASAAAPTASQEIPRLVARLNQNYHRDMPEMHWADGSIFDNGYIRKDHAVALEKDFTLVARYLECTIPEPSWRFGDNVRIPADYRMSAHSTEDCDKERHGLSWQEKIVRQPLATIDPSSIGLEKTGKGDSDSDLRLTLGSVLDKFAFVSMSCKNREACEQMAADLKKTR